MTVLLWSRRATESRTHASSPALRSRLPPAQTRNTQLGLRIEALTAQLDGAGRALAGREVQLAEAGEALLERDAGLRRWAQQVGLVDRARPPLVARHW